MTSPSSSQPNDRQSVLTDEALRALLVGLDWAEAGEAAAEEAAAERRAIGHVRALTWLAAIDLAIEAPVELDGAVVASLFGGHRESRATRQVQSLSARTAPAELDHLVATAIGVPSDIIVAPPELDALVATSIDETPIDEPTDEMGSADEGDPVPGLLIQRRSSVFALVAAAGILVFGLSVAVGGDDRNNDTATDGRVASGESETRSRDKVRLIVERVDVKDLSASERGMLRRAGGFFLGGRS